MSMEKVDAIPDIVPMEDIDGIVIDVAGLVEDIGMSMFMSVSIFTTWVW